MYRIFGKRLSFYMFFSLCVCLSPIKCSPLLPPAVSPVRSLDRPPREQSMTDASPSDEITSPPSPPSPTQFLHFRYHARHCIYYANACVSGRQSSVRRKDLLEWVQRLEPNFWSGIYVFKDPLITLLRIILWKNKLTKTYFYIFPE